MAFAERIQKQLDAGNYTVGVFIDLKNPFDTVDHNILLQKLDYHGIRDVARDWFQSYLDKQNRMPLSMDLIHLSNQFKLMCHKDLL